MAVDITEAVRLLLIEDNPRHAQLLQETMGDVGVAYSGAQPYTLTHVTGLADGLEKLVHLRLATVIGGPGPNLERGIPPDPPDRR